MRTKNARAIDSIESAYLADVKRCACVICDKPPTSEAHHPEQGLHMLAQALCQDDHTGPHGWHGDRSRWRAAKMTERKATNETARRVALLRSSGRSEPTTGRKAAQPRSGGQARAYVIPTKIYRKPEAA